MRFLQAAGDFPCVVSLGEKVPAWGLSRYGGAGLRFVPPDEEGFSVRGDTQRVVYKGRRRSHRFTVLGDTAFEYDCILEREPDSPVITLLMEGAEGFDFFRQPDFVSDPFLKGSYAVYRKETPAGEGTGKLCHIRRPLVIDSRGRRVWGDLSVTGNKLCITIPEEWLSGAKYPVLVDPSVGTTTVGSQTHWDNVDNDSYEQLFFEASVGVNRFLMSEACSGTATAYVYAYSGDYDGRCKPVVYSDNGGIPLNRKSKSEGTFDIAVGSGKPAGWRSTGFQTKDTLAKGSYVWFGIFCDWFAPRFDFGAKCYRDFWDGVGDDIPDTYPLTDAGWYYDFKISAYFSYTSAQNYTRTLTQGVKLTDTRKQTGTYKRNTTHTIRGTSAVHGFEGLYRGVVQTVRNTMILKRDPTLIRNLIEQTGISDTGRRFLSALRKAAYTAWAGGGTQRITRARRVVSDTGRTGTAIGGKQDFKRDVVHTGGAVAAALRNAGYVKRFRETAGNTAYTGIVRNVVIRLVEAAAGLYETRAGTGFNRGITDKAGISSGMGGMGTFFRVLFGRAGNGDSTTSFITRMRVIEDAGTAGDETGHAADYLRGLFAGAGVKAESGHEGKYYRRVQDTACNEGVSLRHLVIFLRLVTGSFVRDYIIGRFLKSKEELVIKSPVCREITFESTLH